jgi:ubiquinone/menaquinone biosynthesis C-methylase UbiE
MGQQQTVTDHFEQMGQDGSYEQFYKQLDTPHTHDFLMRKERIQELLCSHVTAGKRVLDLGCGTGPMVEFFCSRGALYCGVDVAESMLNSIEMKFRDGQYWNKIELRIASCGELPYPDSHFDVVVAMGLLEYLDDMETVLSEISRVAKPKGVVILTIPNLHCVNRFVMRHLNLVTGVYQLWKQRRGCLLNPDHNICHYELSPGSLDRLSEKVGFRRIGRSFYDYKLIVYPLTRIFPDFAFGINKRVENRGPYVLANGYIGLYEKVEASSGQSQ